MKDPRLHGNGAVSPDKIAESKMPGQSSQFSNAREDLNGKKFETGWSPIGQNNHETPGRNRPRQTSQQGEFSVPLNGQPFQSKPLSLPESNIVRPVSREEGASVERLVESFRAGYLKGE